MELIIIAAGNGKRMGNISVPKVLYPVNGMPNLQRILNAANDAGIFDSVYVVIKESAENDFVDYFHKHPSEVDVHLTSINSGYGDGHAIMEALSQIGATDDNAIVVWGDVYIENGMIFKELVSYEDQCFNVIVPVCKEESPYVTILADQDMNVIGADFSKLGEKHFEGLHDQSVFMINKNAALEALQTMHNVLWKNGRYISESKELNFLHAMHYLYNFDEPATCYITEYPTKSFNSIDEVKQIESK